MKLAFYPTGHGYGHLTRLMEVVNQVQRLRPSWSLHLRTPQPAAQVLSLLDAPPASLAQRRFEIGLVQVDSLRHDLAASAEQLAHDYGDEGDARVEAEARWLRETGIDAALIDISPRAFEACELAGVPAWGLSNFSWDDIWQLVGEGELAPFARRASAAYATARGLLRLPMHFGMAAFPRVEDLPLVARRSQFAPDELRARLGLGDEARPLVLLAFGGEGLQGLQPPDKTLGERFRFLATPPLHRLGEPVQHISDEQLASHGLRYYDLLRAVDYAIIKPGYSTISECMVNETPVAIVPRSVFPEGPVLMEAVLADRRNQLMEFEELIVGDWKRALEALHEASSSPLTRSVVTDGSERSAARFVELVEEGR